MSTSPLTEPAENFLQRVEELEEVTHLAASAIAGVNGSADLLRAVAEGQEALGLSVDRSRLEHSVEQAESLESLAEREIGGGLRHLFENASIGVWAALEVALYDMALEWLRHGPESTERERLTEIRVRFTVAELLDMESQARTERLRLILDEIIRSNRGSRRGIGRFEMLFKLIGLDPRWDSASRRDLVELWAVRNLLLHRGRRADDRFVQDYPAEGVSVGDEFLVSRSHFLRYAGAARQAVASLLRSSIVE